MTFRHIFHLYLKLYAREIVHAAYAGILGRDPEERGLNSYTKEIAATGNLSAVLRDLTESREAWEKNIFRHADELVRLVFLGLLEREPDAEALNTYAGQLVDSKDLPALLSVIGTSREHWEKSLGQRSEEIVRAAFQGLLEREPDAEALNTYAGQLADSKDLAALLSIIGTSREHWEKLLGLRSEEIVRAAFHGLLEKTPDAEALNTYAGQLAVSKDLPALLSAIGTSREHWEKSLGQRSEEIVRAAFLGLLEREPDAEALNTYAGQLADSKDLPALLSIIGTSREHWEKLLEKKSEDLVQQMFEGLLGGESDPKALEIYAQKLRTTKNLHQLLTDISTSEEHWKFLINQKSEILVQQIFKGLHGVHPTDAIVKTYSKKLSKSKDFGDFFAQVSASDVFWDCLISKKSLNNLAVIYLPNQDWLLPGLSCASHLFQNTGTKSFFVFDKNPSSYNVDFFEKFPFVAGLCSLRDRKENSLFNSSHPKYVIGHADNSVNALSALISDFPNAYLHVFADGYRNAGFGHEISKTKKISTIYYFGFQDSRKNTASFDNIVVISNSVIQNIIGIMTSYKGVTLTASEPKKYSIFFVRYWGINGYSFPKKLIVDCWTNTVKQCSERNEVIILKVSNSFDSEIISLFKERLSIDGFKVIELATYLEMVGLRRDLAFLSFEGLLHLGALTNAQKHYTLDSSLPYVISNFPQVSRPTEIIVGGSGTSLFAQYAGYETLESNVESQISALRKLECVDIKKLNDVDKHYYHIKLKNNVINEQVLEASPIINSYRHYFTCRPLALVFVPGENWLPYVLAIGDYLKLAHNVELVLISNIAAKKILSAGKFSPNVFGVLNIDELEKVVAETNFSPKMILTHSYGWREESKFLASRFPSAKLYIYGDGFKNELDSSFEKERGLEGAVFFGYDPRRPDTKVEAVIEAEKVFYYSDKLALENSFSFSWNQLGRGADYIPVMVYLRYWGGGPYAFSVDSIVESFLKTILSYVRDGDRVILKSDPRIDDRILEALIKKLADAKVKAESLGTYLGSLGIDASLEKSPLEIFWAKDILTNIGTHIVFDSSLSYSIATNPHILRPCKIIIGGDFDGIFDITALASFPHNIDEQVAQERGDGERSVENGLRTVLNYSRQYKTAILEADSAKPVTLIKEKNSSLFELCLDKRIL